MLDRLPDEILIIIIHYACSKPTEYLSLMSINKCIYTSIYQLNNIYECDDHSYDKDINPICKNNISSLNTFQWLFKNKVKLSLDNIKELIICNRYDVFINGLTNEYFLKIIFNRFYLYIEHDNDIFSLITTKNPLILAGIYNRIEIIKLLLDKTRNIVNPYINLIPSLLDISIKYNHKNLLSYLILNYYSRISTVIQTKLNTIINRISNCEDILFYLMINKKIKLMQKHFSSLIVVNYSDFFIKYYSLNNNNNNNNNSLLEKSVETGNINIFNCIMDTHNPSTKEFTKVIYKKNELPSSFLDNIYIKYLHLIEKKTPFIKLCIQNEMESNKIISLIHQGFVFDDEDMKLSLNQKKYQLLEIMCKERNTV
tara:strand:+ start:6913 stop:8019 length:1107 start_codon:yes stop_codon:yes gene_type:complete